MSTEEKRSGIGLEEGWILEWQRKMSCSRNLKGMNAWLTKRKGFYIGWSRLLKGLHSWVAKRRGAGTGWCGLWRRLEDIGVDEVGAESLEGEVVRTGTG